MPSERPETPHLDRSVHLRLQGDWGGANLTRVCTWLMHELTFRTGAESRIAVMNGRGAGDNVLAVARGEVDLALCTPAAFARMALEGRGPFADEPCPDLRGLAVIPQDDRLVVAIDASLGILSFADLRSQAPPLRIATGPNDGTNWIGLAAHELMAASGVDDATLAGWGGRYLETEWPFPCFEWYESGAADAVIMEAIVAPPFHRALDARHAHFLEPEGTALRSLHERFGWEPGEVAAGWFPHQPTAFTTLDYRDFLVFVRADLPDDLAYLLTWCLVETRQMLERQYGHLPANRSPVNVPFDPAAMRRSPIPLHDAAARCYENLGVG